MEHYKSERQRKLDNVQKEILTNYYLQKYNTIMSQITKLPENQHPLPTPTKSPERSAQRMNFKDMILMKKNQNGSSSRVPRVAKPEPELKMSGGLMHKYSSRQELENQKTMRKLEDSIINQLYKQSPSKLEQGNYRRLQINTSKSKDSTARRQQLDPIPQENIEITYEDQPGTSEFQAEAQDQSEEEQRLEQVRSAIKQSFDRRKEGSFSPKRNCNASSSKISIEIKIQSPQKLQKSATPNKFKDSRHDSRARNDSSMQSSSYRQSDSLEQAQRKNRINSFQLQRHQVHFSKDLPERPQEGNRFDNDEIREEQEIEFVPPSTNYYKSQSNDLVQESFKYQEEIRENRDQDSEKAHSVASSRKSSKQKLLVRNDSKKSIRSRKKSEFKDSSKMEMSFVSRISMLSSDQGLMIKERIEKELYDNQLGPYQSALYNVLQLMERNPRSGPVFAVGQKALEDRRAFQDRRSAQQSQISELKRKIQKIKRRASQLRAMQPDQQTIRTNQLQILRLIRKLSTTL